MKINGLYGANTQIGGMNMKAIDSVSKNIQNQITNAQKQLQDISANKDMSIEEKMKKRQEILQEIIDLNNQLRQHQMELRKEKQQAKGSSMNDMLGGSTKTAPKAGKQSAGLSQASMKAIMSADSAMAQAQVQGSVATRMEGRAGVLESEIKLDSARGGNVEAKKAELAEVQEKMEAAQEAQLNTLADANKELEEAAKADQKAEKTSGGDSAQKSTLMKNGADALKKSADALNNSELWEKNDFDAITKAVKSFVEDYNDVIKQAGDSNSKDVLRNAVWLTGMTEANENILSKIGITVGKGNETELDEEALKKADIQTLKSVFTGYNSFADKVSMKANSISNAAARTSGTYRKNGTYNNVLSELVSKKVDEDV